mmetsp:Transcript_13160/g.23600  ORF Transcript_13160/g.23600 Transcript_13160/m.23600 type:complete len:301 (-) Transcript_13160:5219-6121(-)
MRPMAWVSQAVYPCWVGISRGCTKMAWLQLVRLAPLADSSPVLRRSTRAFPSASLCISSKAAVLVWTLPFSCRAFSPTLSMASATCCIRSGNWTNTRTRSVAGRDLIRDTTFFSFVPYLPPASWAWSAPRSTTRMALEARMGTVHPSTGHSFFSANSNMHTLQPRCPQHEKMTCFSTGTRSAPHAGQATSRPLPCRSRTALKYRSDRIRPTISFCSRRSWWTSSRSSHLSALSASSAALVCFPAPDLAPAPAFFRFLAPSMAAARIAFSCALASASPQPSLPVSFSACCHRLNGSSSDCP